MEKTIKDIANYLKDNKASILAGQRAYELTLPESERDRYCRNRHTIGGWVVPGIAAYTLAVKRAGLPNNHYWSGSAPTPSTQYPYMIYRAIIDFLDTNRP